MIDDWGIYPFARESVRDTFEIMEGRSHEGSVVVVSQIRVDAWYDIIAAPTTRGCDPLPPGPQSLSDRDDGGIHEEEALSIDAGERLS